MPGTPYLREAFAMRPGPVGGHDPQPALHPTVPLLACLLILAAAACGGRADTESAETKADTAAPSPEEGLEGTWRGATSQGELFEFTVVGNAIESFTVSFTSPGCEGESPISVFYGQPEHLVSEEGFSFVEPGLHRVTIAGTFGPGATASGSVQIALRGPCESLDLTWEATLGGAPPEIEIPEGAIPDLEIPEGLFDPEAGAARFDEFTQVLGSRGDWFLVRTSMESDLPVPSGWTTEETGQETLISFSEDRDPSDPSIVVRVGFEGFEGDERASDDVLAELRSAVEGERDISLREEKIVDDGRLWVFLEVTTESGETRYLLNLYSKHAQKGFFYDLLVFTFEDDWPAYYPLVLAMVDGWRGLDGSPLGMPLPASLVD